MKTITQAQYYQLIGLRAAADKQHAVLDAITKAAQGITGEVEDDGSPAFGGHTMDYIWGSDEIDSLLKRLQIEVTSS